MDITSFREAILSTYIIEINSWSRDKLINTLMDLKLEELESTADSEIVKYYERKPKPIYN